ncbi:uncharacterized protein TNIN_173951 [Trichonephila inaurata madagascariensis]|uniref:Uncharacterized protein n=1 Tax=Trichonephila inaurata madagascariensis TaxID=2747483 RepID=A0A8X6YND4_9ARAC|nr:uncharacterized protein TNIN_173951 [Trichonephila inaurata madagascariensis]
MGMSTDMAPRYLSVNPAGQMTYVLDTSTVNLTQVQLAVPASDIVLIQDESKSINLCDNSSVLVADVTPENVGWLGNNVIVLVTQPQEFVMVEQEVIVDSNVTQTWQVEDGSTACGASTSLAEFTLKENQEEEYEISEEVSTTTVEDAKCWFRDSLITTAALSTLTTYVESNGSTKVG